jgi:hypothetical protein
MTNTYIKPKITTVNTYNESVYLSSGSTQTSSSTAPLCDSKYLNGVYHAPNYNDTTTYLNRFGCLGCPAFRYNGCGLQLEQYWGSYDVDNGNRYPSWEKIGHKPQEPIDWSDVGLL